MERNQRVDYEINQSAQKEKALAWLPKVRAYYAGETHAHSRWSDRSNLEHGGRERRVHEISRVLEYADKLGLEFVFFSEHASNPGRPVKLSPEDPICLSLLEEKKSLDKLNSSGKFKPRAFLASETSIFLMKTGKR